MATPKNWRLALWSQAAFLSFSLMVTVVSVTIRFGCSSLYCPKKMPEKLLVECSVELTAVAAFNILVFFSVFFSPLDYYFIATSKLCTTIVDWLLYDKVFECRMFRIVVVNVAYYCGLVGCPNISVIFCSFLVMFLISIVKITVIKKRKRTDQETETTNEEENKEDTSFIIADFAVYFVSPASDQFRAKKWIGFAYYLSVVIFAVIGWYTANVFKDDGPAAQTPPAAGDDGQPPPVDHRDDAATADHRDDAAAADADHRDDAAAADGSNNSSSSRNMYSATSNSPAAAASTSSGSSSSTSRMLPVHVDVENPLVPMPPELPRRSSRRSASIGDLRRR